MKFPKRALIDLGSNSIRFVIYKVKKGKYKEEINVKRTARLSMHIDEYNNITAKGVEKIISSFQFFKQIAKFHQVNDIQCFATAIMREAPNQSYVIKKIAKLTNIKVDVLTAYEEAYYGFVGVIQSTDVSDGITIDIGGGSTEVTLFENGTLKHAHSFPFGAVTLTKDFVKGKKPTDKEMARLSNYLYDQFSELPWLISAQKPMIGIGGTARNIRKVFKKNNLSSNGMKQPSMKQEDIRTTSTYLQSFSLRKRKKVAGLSKERADIIIPGIEAIHQLMEVVQAPSFDASKQGLREGLCCSALFADAMNAK